MARRFDLGDYVRGIVVDGDTGRTVTPRRQAGGFVVGIYPHMPAVALVEMADGASTYVKVAR